MYIQPNSTIILLKNVPLTKDYTDTLWFDNITNQTYYFNALTGSRTYNAYSYQRVNRNTIRIGDVADDLYDYNYMMFRNTAYGNKWFYAFVTKVNYINDSVTELVYSIDVMQTWLFDVTIGECFVEREHSESDVAGENIQAEPFSINNLVCDWLYWDNNFRIQTNWYVAVAWSDMGDST